MFTIVSLCRTKLANRITTRFVLAASMLVLGSASVTADAACRTINGRFDITLLPVEDCPSPVGLCGQGTFLGGILGD